MSLLGARRIPSGLHVMPSSRWWSPSVTASISSSPSISRTVASSCSGIAPPGGVKLAVDAQRVAVERRAVGDEAHLRVALDVKEVLRAQVLVALGQLRFQAGRLDRQLDGRRGAEVQRALVVGELALDGHQAVEVAHVERDAGPCRVKPPGSGGNRRSGRPSWWCVAGWCSWSGGLLRTGVSCFRHQ